MIARFHLDALSAAETASYVQHRLTVGGLNGPSPFGAAVLKQIHRLTGGVPRRINLLCDRALLGAYAEGHKQVEKSTLAKAAGEVFADDDAPRRPWMLVAGLAALVLAMAGTLATGWTALNKRNPEAKVAAAVPARPASAPSADLIAQPADEAKGLGELASLWQAKGSDCTALAAEGLQCLRSEAGLASLRYLDRPALLHIGSGWLLLEQISGQEATLRQGALKQTVSLTQLGQAWHGEFQTLWRAPPGYQGRVLAGASLDWVAQALTKIDGAPVDPQLDAEMRRRIAAFQRTQGLSADGIAGPVTLMQLARAAGAVNEPRLLK